MLYVISCCSIGFHVLNICEIETEKEWKGRGEHIEESRQVYVKHSPAIKANVSTIFIYACKIQISKLHDGAVDTRNFFLAQRRKEGKLQDSWMEEDKFVLAWDLNFSSSDSLIPSFSFFAGSTNPPFYSTRHEQKNRFSKPSPIRNIKNLYLPFIARVIRSAYWDSHLKS